MRVAVLDKDGRLVGAREAKNPKKDDIDCGDLPADGTYYHNGKGAFIPVGFGAGKPAANRITADRALYYFMNAMIEGHPIPKECRDWCAEFKKRTRV